MARKERYDWTLEEDILLKNANREGHTDREIAEQIGCTYETVLRHRKMLGLPSNSKRKGGVISRTIPDSEIHRTVASEIEEPEWEEASAMCVVTRTVVTIQGVGTEAKYTLDSESKKVTVELDGLGFEIEFKKLDDLISELKGVRRKADTMKTNMEVL